MNCRDARLLLHAWLDDELGAAESVAVVEHLATCPACAQALQAHARLRDAMRTANLSHPAPTALRERLLARLPQPGRAPRTARRDWRFAIAALAALFVMTAALAGWQTFRLGRQADNALVAEAVSDHVRSLLPGHLIDVQTSDQHTVKPWFDGRVDFSPQVKDLAAQGFTLVGGRLDVLGGKPVAALVYKRHQHLINLFEWPDHAAVTEKPQTRDGYHVLAWHEAGMRFLAVSSVAEDDLHEFALAFRTAQAGADTTTH